MKVTPFFFIATFAGSLFYFENTADFLGGAVFVVVGIFVVSIFVAAPFFMLKKKYEHASWLFALLQDVATVCLTIMAFSFFFTDPSNFAVKAVEGDVHSYSLQCEQAIPEFTLSGNSIPTEAEASAICTCVWEAMSPWARDASTLISAGKEGEVSDMHLHGFIAHFGQKLEACNVNDL